MDIEALLAASNLEATADDSGYNTDEFEDEGTDQGNSKDGKSGPEDKIAILKAAAAKVAVEEKRIADRVFNETADNIREDLKAKKLSERDAEDILADASKAVNEHYNKQGAPDADKFRTIKEEKESDEEVDEGEDDEEDDNANEDPQLNRSLLFACFNEKVELLKSTLKKGAYYFTRDRHGWTALHWAASKGNDDLAEALLSHVQGTGHNMSKFVNAQDKISGWTAMHVACVNGSLDVIEVLLKYKARKNKLNFFKEKPVDCVGKVKRAAIRKLLGVVVPVRNDPPLAMESDDAFGAYGNEHKHSEDTHDHRQEQRQEYRQPVPPHGGIPSGRARPGSNLGNSNMYAATPQSMRGGALHYDTGSDDGSSRSSAVHSQYGHREEKSYR